MAVATQKIIIHADDKTGAAIASAIRNSKKLDGQLRATGDTMRNTTRQSRAHMAQLGHQVQDVAVQLQMGMNPLMVFAQQGSQIASIFGVGGAMLGGLIAVAAVIGQQLVPNLFKANKELGELKDGILELVDSANELTAAEKAIVMAGFADEIDKQKAKITTLNEAIRKEGEIVRQNTIAKQNSTGSILAEEKAIKKALAKINEMNAERAKEARILQQLIDKRNEYNDPQGAAANKAIAAMEKGAVGLQAQASSALAAMDGVDMYSEAVKEAADANKKFNHSFELVNINFGQLAGNNIPMASEAVTELDTKITDTTRSVEGFDDSLEDARRELDMFTQSSLSAVEDGLVDIISRTSSAKDAFANMARSIINDMIRMQIRSSMMPAISGLFNAAVGNVAAANTYGTNVGSQQTAMLAAQDAGLRANGGPVSGGKPYIVGERGPELMIPTGSGRVIPNNKLGGGDNVTVNLNISTGVSQTVRAELTSMIPQIQEMTKAAVVQAKMRGGSFASAFGA